EPAGHGFDEAATEAAKKFLFEPARRGSTPIPVRIPFRYSFTLTPAPVQEPAPPADSLRGTVLSSEGDVPIVGATVEVGDDNGPGASATTDDQGAWKFTGLPAGQYKIPVTAAGYDTKQDAEAVVEGTVAELVYRLTTPSAGIEVTVRGQRP